MNADELGRFRGRQTTNRFFCGRREGLELVSLQARRELRRVAVDQRPQVVRGVLKGSAFGDHLDSLISAVYAKLP